MRISGAHAVIVIATSGEATDGDVVTALRPLASLPAAVAVRLCNATDSVLRYVARVCKQVLVDVG